MKGNRIPAIVGRGIHGYARGNHSRNEELPPPPAGEILSPTSRKLKPVLHGEDDEDTVEKAVSEKWIEDFESACWRRRGRGGVHQPWWLDRLLLQAPPHARHRVSDFLTSLGQERPSPSRCHQHLEVRDSLLLEHPHRFSQLPTRITLPIAGGGAESTTFSRTPGGLWKHYEAARLRDVKATPPREIAHVTEFFISLRYSRALRPAVRAEFSPLMYLPPRGESKCHPGTHRALPPSRL